MVILLTLTNQVQYESSNECKFRSQERVKFIHASDIHLGAAQYQNEHRANDFIYAFQEILLLAIKHRADFIILGGDVFTSLEMLPGNLTKIIAILTNFKNRTKETIPIITIEGNHDIRKFSRGTRLHRRGQSWLKLIASLGLVLLLDADLEAPESEMFKPYDFKIYKGGKIQIKNVVIYGNRYIGQKPEEYLSKINIAIKKDDHLFNILIQHFGIAGQLENVPGVRLEKAEILKEKVDYLALGHFHKQFIINNWIFNPGSSEAASSVDSTYKRGIFMVEIFGISHFTKKVYMIRLQNRKHHWESIFIPRRLKNKEELYNFVIDKLQSCFKYYNFNPNSSNVFKPILYLVLKGSRSSNSFKINEKEFASIIAEHLPILYTKIYQKFTNSLRTLDLYM